MKKIEFEVRTEGIKEIYEGNVGLTSIIREVGEQAEFDATVHGTTNDQDLVFLGLAGLAGIIDHLKDKYPDKTDEEIYGLTAESFVVFMKETKYGLLLDTILEQLEADFDDFVEVEPEEEESSPQLPLQNSIFDLLSGINNPINDGEEEEITLVQELTFSNKKEKGIDREVEMEVNFLGEKEQLKGKLALYNVKKMDLTGEEKVVSDVRGSGQIDDLIKLGCDSYNFALSHAIEKWLEAEPSRNRMEIQMLVYQRAMQYLMGAQFGNLGIDDLFGQIFSKEDHDEEES